MYLYFQSIFYCENIFYLYLYFISRLYQISLSYSGQNLKFGLKLLSQYFEGGNPGFINGK